MYHSHLLINVGDDPDRPDWNICRRWLRNLYRVHQRLCMAFPSIVPAEHERAAAYCLPFADTRFPRQRPLPTEMKGDAVHETRSEETGFLFRIDYPVDLKRGVRRPVIIVQSTTPPDWNHAFGLTKDLINERERPIGNSGFLLAAPPQCKPVSIDLDGNALLLFSEKQVYRLSPGDLVRFRLRVNPTRRDCETTKRKRVKPTPEDHADWLSRKLGDAIDGPFCFENFLPGWAYGWRTKYEPQQGQRMQWWSVLFEGSFRVKDTHVLKSLLESGIGPAKAFGFGLLSIAPVHS